MCKLVFTPLLLHLSFLFLHSPVSLFARYITWPPSSSLLSPFSDRVGLCVFFCGSQPWKVEYNPEKRPLVMVEPGRLFWSGGLSGSQAVRECNLFFSHLLKRIPLQHSTQIFSLTAGGKTFWCLSACECVVIFAPCPSWLTPWVWPITKLLLT